jgi:integrase/recombinase XerD
MRREFIQELRGDRRKEAIDIYNYIDKKELRESYLAHIPQLGI